jgi:hypothetical protein
MLKLIFGDDFEEVIRVISIGAIRSKSIDNAGPVFNMP